MQISTKISTQIVLSQDELKEAAIDFVKARTEVPADATFEVDFADDTADASLLTAIIDITGTTLATAPADKPKVTRTRAAPKPKDETKAEEEPVSDTPAEPEPEPAIRIDPENRQDPNNPDPPPFEEDVKKEEPAPPAKVEAKPTSTIFPQTNTSAPTLPKPDEEVDPTVKAKSLFANLSRPTN